MSVRELSVARGADALLRGCDHDGSYYTYLLTYVFDVFISLTTKLVACTRQLAQHGASGEPSAAESEVEVHRMADRNTIIKSSTDG
jgi:hypothetical protein